MKPNRFGLRTSEDLTTYIPHENMTEIVIFDGSEHFYITRDPNTGRIQIRTWNRKLAVVPISLNTFQLEALND